MRWFQRWRTRKTRATSPYRWQPLTVPPTVSPRWGLLAVFATAAVLAPASRCFSTALYGLAMDGPSVSPPIGAMGRSVLVSFVAAVIAWETHKMVRPRRYATAALVGVALVVPCMAAAGAYATAALHWDRGCARGEADMCHDAAKARQYGIGVHRDAVEARRLRARACALGEPWSCLEALRENRVAAPPGACVRVREMCARDAWKGDGSPCRGVAALCPTEAPVRSGAITATGR